MSGAPYPTTDEIEETGYYVCMDIDGYEYVVGGPYLTTIEADAMAKVINAGSRHYAYTWRKYEE